MNNFKNSVKNVMIVFTIFFVGLISYIAYFQAFKAHDISNDTGNKRLWAKRNEVLRGTIYDKDMNALTKSEITGDLTQSRSYTYNDLYAHAIGYESQQYGFAGLEASYDEELTTYSDLGTGFRSFLKDFSFDALKKSFEARGEEQKKVGNSVVTTLDYDVQKAAYDALGNNRGAVVALDPTSGKVLAMVSKPSFNPNDLETVMKNANNDSTADSVLLNRATSGNYPPGSTFKTITTVSALDNLPGVTNRTFNDTGCLELGGGKTLSNYGGEVNGPINLKQAFGASSNFVYGSLAMELGNSKLKETAEKFGFNKTIPAEGFSIVQSSFPSLESFEKGMIAQSGIGQASVTATPMQMALVCSTVANNGVMMQPTLVDKVIDMNGNTVKTISPKKYAQILSSSDASTMKDYMESYVGEKGWSSFSGLNAAGKTGTADHNNPDGTPASPHSWFIGYAPANDPKVAVAVIVEDGGVGAKTAAPVAANVMRAALG